MLLKSPTVPSVALIPLNIPPICLFADWHRKMMKSLRRSAAGLTWHAVFSGEGRSRKVVIYNIIPAVALLINCANLRTFTSMTTREMQRKKTTQQNKQPQMQHLNEFSFHICWSNVNFCAHSPKPTSSGAPGFIHNISHFRTSFFLAPYNDCSSYFGLCLYEGKPWCSWGLAETYIQPVVSAYFFFLLVPFFFFFLSK